MFSSSSGEKGLGSIFGGSGEGKSPTGGGGGIFRSSSGGTGGGIFGESDNSGNDSGLGSFFGKKQNKSIFGRSNDGSNLGVALIPEAFQEEPACAKLCPKLTFKQRIIGFIACAAFGYLLSLFGTLILIGGPTSTNIRTFVVLYVVGNLIALFATGFLLGPRTHCKKMWLPKRRFSTAFYLFMLAVVFVVAVLKQNVLLVLFLLLIEVCAGIWYAVSYIPMGRKFICMMLRRSGICMPCFFVYDGMKDSIAQQQGAGSGMGSSGGSGGGGSGTSSSGGSTLSALGLSGQTARV